jgi:hypothetical protein
MVPNLFLRESVHKRAEVVEQQEKVARMADPAHKVALNFQTFLGEKEVADQ